VKILRVEKARKTSQRFQHAENLYNFLETQHQRNMRSRVRSFRRMNLCVLDFESAEKRDDIGFHLLDFFE
jgi:hypothetical protein